MIFWIFKKIFIMFCLNLDSAGTTNACSTNNGGCPHLCLPKPDGQKTCACTTGFIPSQDESQCEQYESYAVVSSAEFIRGFHINSSDHSEAMVPVGASEYWLEYAKQFDPCLRWSSFNSIYYIQLFN